MARNSQKKLTKKTAKAKGTGSALSKASAKKGSKPAAKKASKAPAKKAKKLAKIKSTGGYGFAFEDKVAGQLLIRMLDGLEPWNITGSRVERLSFQVAASGWKLDDLLLEMRNDAGPLFCSVSVKSAAYLSVVKQRSSSPRATLTVHPLPCVRICEEKESQLVVDVQKIIVDRIVSRIDQVLRQFGLHLSPKQRSDVDAPLCQ